MRKIVIGFMFFCSMAYSQSGMPYQIYTSSGKKVSYENMVRVLAKNDIVFFGELHNNSLGHWIQLQVTKSLGLKRKLVLGAEMFESDNQEGLTNYVQSKSTEEILEKEVRLWTNYKTDYKPLVEYAKSNIVSFIATNVPRRYASLLFKNGIEALDTLSSQEKQWIAPLPFPYDAELPGYRNMLTMFEDHSDENLPKAQAIKDATMAHFIVENLKEKTLFLHFNGAYHSNHFEGIIWYINKYRSGLKIGTISMVESDNVQDFEIDNLGLANFIIVIDANILKSF